MEISIVKVIRNGITKEGENITSTFSVNRVRVIKALHWLKKHNQLYRDIIIAESNLDWMSGKKEVDITNIINIEITEDEKEDNDR